MWEAFASAPAVSWLAAAAPDASSLDITTIITGGITPAIIVVLFLSGKIYPAGIVEAYKAEMKTARDERDAALKAFEQLSSQMVERVVPALTLSTRVLESIDLNESGPGRRPSPRTGG